MKLRPLHDRVLVEPLEAEEKTAGGIIIPDTAKEKPMEGKIVAAGNGARSEDGTVTPLDVKSGDRILYGNDRVLVEPLEAEEKTAGGIIIPDTAKEKPMGGKIVAAGNGARSEDGTVTPLDVKSATGSSTASGPVRK